MADSETGVGNILDVPTISHARKKKNFLRPKQWDYVKGTQEASERVLNVQS